MRILLDVDGVVADFVSAFIAAARVATDYRLSAKPEHVTEWNVAKALGLTGAEEARAWEIMKRNGVARRMAVYPEAQTVVRHWQRSGGKIVWVTAPLKAAPTWAHDRAEWLREHFSASDQDIVFTDSKHFVVGDVFIDDRPETVSAWRRAHPKARAFILDRPWNRVTDVKNLVRLSSLAEVGRYLPTLAPPLTNVRGDGRPRYSEACNVRVQAERARDDWPMPPAPGPAPAPAFAGPVPPRPGLKVRWVTSGSKAAPPVRTVAAVRDGVVYHTDGGSLCSTGAWDGLLRRGLLQIVETPEGDDDECPCGCGRRF